MNVHYITDRRRPECDTADERYRYVLTQLHIEIQRLREKNAWNFVEGFVVGCVVIICAYWGGA